MSKLTNEQLLLMDQWVNAYKKVTDQKLDSIKKEAEMAFVATTITEHIQHESEVKGEIKGKIEGEIKGKIQGKIQGKIELAESLYLQGILSKDQYEKVTEPLRRELVRILSESGK